MFFLTFVGLAGLVAVSGTILYRLFLSPLNNVPGPFWGRCSMFWKLWHVWNDTYRLAIRGAHEKHGPCVRIMHNEVSVCSDDAIKKVLVPLYDKSPWYSIFAMPDTSFVNQMSEVRAVKYSETRKKVVPAYSLSAVLKHEGSIDELIDLLQGLIDKFMKDAGKISLPECFTFFAFDLTGIVTFSSDLGFLKQQRDIDGIVANSEQLCKYLAVLGFFPTVNVYLSRCLGPVLAWLDIEPMKHVLRTTKASIEQHRILEKARGPSEKVSQDMLDAWRGYQGPIPLTERQIFAACLGNIAAGGDTLGGMLQAVVWYILCNPEVKRKLDIELKAAQAAGKLSSPAQYSETLKLSYFQACIKEVFRMHPLNVTGMARVVPVQGVEVAGQHLPVGTILNVNQWALHYARNIFGEDAHEYKPDRWLEPNASALEKHLIPFGSGYMACPGRQLATVAIEKLIVSLLLDYDISLVDSTADWRIHESVLTKASGWEVRMKKNA